MEQPIFDAVIRSCAADRKVNPTATLDFVKQVLPLNLSGDLKLTANVSLDQIEAKVRRMKIPDVRKFLVSDAANGLQVRAGYGFQAKAGPVSQFMRLGVRTKSSWSRIVDKTARVR